MTYTSSSDAFVASGYTSLIYDQLGDPDHYFLWNNDGTWTLNATITDAGELTGGSLEIYAAITDETPELVLSGDLFTGFSGPGGAFGFGDAPAEYEIFEFLFNITGGSLAGEYGDNYGGVILTANFQPGDTAFAGGWTSDFNSSSGLAVADTVTAVPEPSSAALIFLGLLASAASRNRAKALSARP